MKNTFTYRGIVYESQCVEASTIEYQDRRHYFCMTCERPAIGCECKKWTDTKWYKEITFQSNATMNVNPLSRKQAATRIGEKKMRESSPEGMIMAMAKDGEEVPLLYAKSIRFLTYDGTVIEVSIDKLGVLDVRAVEVKHSTGVLAVIPHSGNVIKVKGVSLNTPEH